MKNKVHFAILNYIENVVKEKGNKNPRLINVIPKRVMP